MDTLQFFSPQAAKPAWGLLAMEPMRAALEFAGMQLMPREHLPRGDGHPVVIFPGLAAERLSVAPLKTFCAELGYTAYDWGRGFNRGPHGNVERWIRDLARDVRDLTQHHAQKVTLIGWSLGGIYAREVSKELAPHVRQVITLGTPIHDTLVSHHVAWLYRLLNGESMSGDGEPIDEGVLRRLSTPPAVATTSIYSRSDGIVAWESCLQGGNARHAENIEVRSSHCGMGWNAEVLEIIAARLSQPIESWTPHARTVGAAGARAKP